MARIIAGWAGSLKLDVPRKGTRPSSERVREAIFSALEARKIITGARVLDLYAGSGALGLESASRGASTVALVERAPEAARIARANGARVWRTAPIEAKPVIRSYAQTVRSFLTQNRDSWDLVFIDPPYALDTEELGDILSLLLPRLAPQATVLVENILAGGI